MEKIYAKLYDFLEIGDDFPTVIMGVLNLSPESFYQGSVYKDNKAVENAAMNMVKNGAKMLDLGARSTAPWSKNIDLKEEISRLKPAMELICSIIPKDVIISVDTQFSEVAQVSYDLAAEYNKKIVINDVSCLKTDPTLKEFLIEKNLPSILMASKKVPGDLCTIEEIIEEFRSTIKILENDGYDLNNLILDPGIGKWIEKKMYTYDLKIINDLFQLRELKKPILVAISRKSFIGTTLNIPDPIERLNGTLSATAIAVYNGANIVRTHDVNQKLLDIVKMAEKIRKVR